ncbi:tail fiber assembly protein [Escherichia coli]|uniref:Tail fiber assembly protein n=1 Tax=Escherichia coli TaxID=562 RepID=A0A376MUF3_ECOLX|nr:tail fiber assembly protein [Escherichia coli]
MSNTAVLDENGIATFAGDITVYHYDEETREYTSSSVEYLALGVGTRHIHAPMPRQRQCRVT